MSKSVPAVERAIHILNVFKDGKREMGVSELSRLLGFNKSTVHNIVKTLTQHGFLERDENSRKYRLGPGLIELGYLAQAQRGVQQIAHPYLEQLMQATHHTVLLGVFENDGITVIDKAEPVAEMKVAVNFGQRLPFCAGCFGWAFLAWMPEKEVDRLLESPGLKQFTENSIIDPQVCKNHLQLTRELGYAVDDSEEYLKGVWAVSAPVHGRNGVAAAITVLGFTSKMTAEEKQEIIRLTVQTAHQVTLQIGGPAGAEVD